MGKIVSGTFYDTYYFIGRAPRVDVGGEIYHIINRANARLQIFFKEEDYKLFESILEDAVEKYEVRVLAYCIMPNHFHLIVQPIKDRDLQRFMQWLTLTHTQRWHVQNKTIGSGSLYQGRYKSFLIQQDQHLLTVIRYVERNPLRAKLVNKIQNWKYSSAYHRLCSTNATVVSTPPISLPVKYGDFLQKPLTITELEAARIAVNKGKPFGTNDWSDKMIQKYKLEMTQRGKGRPKKGT